MLFSVLLACSSYALEKGAADAAGADTAGNFDAGGESAADAPEAAPTPSHWTLSGVVRVVEGHLTQEGTSLSLLVVDARLGVTFCAAEVNVGAAATETPPDPALQAWWSDLAPDRAACDLAPARISWGLGPLEPDLLAQLGPAGVTPSEGMAGSFVAPEDSAPLALGVALPTALSEPPSDGGPAPTDWTVAALYLVPLDVEAR